MNRQHAGKWVGALVAMLLGAGAAAQETGFGCRGLLNAVALPAVEGEAGQFFRVDPELKALNRVPQAALEDLVRLSDALERAGTRLVYVPTPSKALAAPHLLPPLAGYLGFDADLAVSVHDEMIKDMRKAGLTVVDARAALRRAGQVEPVFFGPDPRPNMTGQRALAQAVAERIAQTPGFGAVPKTQLVTLEGAPQPIPSIMRFRLQERCQSDLPDVMGQLSAVRPAPGAVMPAQEAHVAVISSDMTGDPLLNFAGQLAQSLGMQVEQSHVPGGGAFDAMAAYMTSDAFTQRPPRYLVWENPVWHSLGAFGDQPIAELIAATQPCDVPLAGRIQGNRIVLDLTGLQTGRAYALRLDTASDVVREARFHMTTPQGLIRSRAIRRAAGAPLTGRFYMPLTGGEALPLRAEIEIDGVFGRAPSVTACPMESQP